MLNWIKLIKGYDHENQKLNFSNIKLKKLIIIL